MSDVGRYWMTLPPQYRNLSHIALVLLSVPPHAAGVERCFSATGRIHSKDRNRQKQPDGPAEIVQLREAEKQERERRRKTVQRDQAGPAAAQAADMTPATVQAAAEERQQAQFDANLAQIAHRRKQMPQQLAHLPCSSVRACGRPRTLFRPASLRPTHRQQVETLL